MGDLRRRMLAEAGPTAALAAEARQLAESANAAGDEATEFEAIHLLLTLLAWQGAVEAAAPALARLAALNAQHPGVFAHGAEFARLAGDRRGTAALCEDGWRLAEAAPLAEGRGLLLGCWAWACEDPEKFEWCVETGNALDVADALTDLDIVAFHGHVADAALDLEDWDLAIEQGEVVAKAFPREAVPPLAEFLRKRTLALYYAGMGELDRELGQLLRDLVDEAERNGWTAWLPALDAALALAPET
ncbi:hypothetical protein [Desertibaculum subflavum]|uniref:hypothetical protein n=1 Tax=Desertibaculum subflavum TaxID=2268458 RepID=UPI000E66E231